MTLIKKLQFIFYNQSTQLYAFFEDSQNGIIEGDILESDSNANTLAGARILLKELHPDLEGDMLVGSTPIEQSAANITEKQQQLENDWTSLWTHTKYYELLEFLCEQQIYNKNDLSSYSFVIFLSEQGEQNLKSLRNVKMVTADVINEKFQQNSFIDDEDINDGGILAIIDKIEKFMVEEESRDNTYIQFVNKEKDRERYIPDSTFVPVHAIYKGVFKRKYEHWHTWFVGRNKFPQDSLLEKVRAIIVPGSSAGAWENKEWVKNLSAFLKRTYENYPHIKMVGICFGFQIIAQTFGGSVKQLEARKKDPHFHVTGNQKLEINPDFYQQRFVRDIIPAHTTALHINKGHGDFVETIRSDFFNHMGSSTTAQNELVLSKDSRIICFQGHPEYAYEYSRRLMASFSLLHGKKPEEWDNHMTTPEFNELFSQPNDHETFVKIINNFIRII